MATPEFFTRLGLFIQRDFLDAEFCTSCLSEMHSAISEPALILRSNESTQTANYLVDQDSRKTGQINVSKATRSHLANRLLTIQSSLEQHFDTPLLYREKPMFYMYKTGDFFGVHQDQNDGPGVPKHIQSRCVSTVIFLNDRSEMPKPGFYGNGALTFYGLIDEPQWQDYGFQFPSESGMLVAFRSTILHEVKPVVHGERYTIASWFSQTNQYLEGS